MKKIISALDRFFFEEVSASGFGLMRIAWAATVLLFFLTGAPDVVRYYSEAGILPEDLWHLVFRNDHRYTLLTYFTDPTAVVFLWGIFMLCLVCMMIGLWPRVMTITCVLLLFSFHERNLQPLGGGDTVLRCFGFILMIAPEISAFSVSRLEQQWKNWKKKGEYLAPLKTHIWAYRLLLWQFMIIYVTSAWDKLQGTMWLDGTVVEAAFHHTHFVRWPKEVMDSLVWMSPYAGFYTLIWEFAWLLLLVPKSMWDVLPYWWRKHSLKRWLIAGALLFHWGIFVLMDVGSFPFAMTAGLLGLLMAEDFDLYTRIANRTWKGRIYVLFDGTCGLCRRSVFFLMLMDGLDRLTPVDFRDAELKKKYAATVKDEELDRAMHIKMPAYAKASAGRPGAKYFKGFDAFRKMSWHLPWTRVLTPLFYLPGVPPIGRMIYSKIADSRDRCAHGGACKI